MAIFQEHMKASACGSVGWQTCLILGELSRRRTLLCALRLCWVSSCLYCPFHVYECEIEESEWKCLCIIWLFSDHAYWSFTILCTDFFTRTSLSSLYLWDQYLQDFKFIHIKIHVISFNLMVKSIKVGGVFYLRPVLSGKALQPGFVWTREWCSEHF